MLIAECYVIVHESQIAWTRGQPGGVLSEQPPGLVGEPIGLAITAAEQKQHDFRRQVLNLMLQRIEFDRSGMPGVPDNRVGAS